MESPTVRLQLRGSVYPAPWLHCAVHWSHCFCALLCKCWVRENTIGSGLTSCRRATKSSLVLRIGSRAAFSSGWASSPSAGGLVPLAILDGSVLLLKSHKHPTDQLQAWNIRPKQLGKRWVPSSEFMESFLIFFYGITNIFLEHLGGSNAEWSAQDLEHVAITVLFIGGGLVN